MKYNFKYKKNFFWISKKVIGHGLERKNDGSLNENRMVLYFEDGSIEVIADWLKYSLKLGIDWVLAQKTALEKETNQKIQLSIGK